GLSGSLVDDTRKDFDYLARVWSADGKLLSTLTGHKGIVTSALFSPDGSRIVTASYDKTARVWAANGELLTTLTGHEGRLASAVFSPNGRYILTYAFDGDSTVRLWSSGGHLVAV